MTTFIPAFNALVLTFRMSGHVILLQTRRLNSSANLVHNGSHCKHRPSFVQRVA